MPMNKPAFKIIDARPQVGIFEIVEGEMLIDSEDTLSAWNSHFFDGTRMHLHATDVKTLVKHSRYISDKTKVKFEADPNEYLHWPRGRVDFDTHEKKWNIMSSSDVIDDSAMIEKITRAFHLPPVASGNIVLVKDDGHYGY